jgi:hypothetical protein
MGMMFAVTLHLADGAVFCESTRTTMFAWMYRNEAAVNRLPHGDLPPTLLWQG